LSLNFCGFVGPKFSSTRHNPFRFLQSFEEVEQAVTGSLTSRRGLDWASFGEDRLFQGEVGVEVDLGGFHRFVTQPDRNESAVHICQTLRRSERDGLHRRRDPSLTQEFQEAVQRGQRAAAGLSSEPVAPEEACHNFLVQISKAVMVMRQPTVLAGDEMKMRPGRLGLIALASEQCDVTPGKGTQRPRVQASDGFELMV
jgi:hypothetical protein